MQTTKIEWTDATWNPIRGCSRVSEGCQNRYAERVAHRYGGTGQPSEGLTHIVKRQPSWNGKVVFAEDRLLDPLKWRGLKLYHPDFPRSVGSMQGMRIFVNSMCDLFHENVPDEWIDRIFAVMALCPQYTFQVLTKRPERMLAYLELSTDNREEAIGSNVLYLSNGVHSGILELPLPNVHLGVSVEDQKTADDRIPLLLQTPASVRFLSAEPLLASIKLPRMVYLPHAVYGDFPFGHDRSVVNGNHIAYSNPLGALSVKAQNGRLLGIKPDEFDDCGIGLDWVIVGGESGPRARPMHPGWVRGIRDQCVDAGVPFFFKQWGEWAHFDVRDFNMLPIPPDGPKSKRLDEFTWMEFVGKKAAGAVLDGREWKEFPRAVNGVKNG